MEGFFYQFPLPIFISTQCSYCFILCQKYLVVLKLLLLFYYLNFLFFFQMHETF